MSEKTEKVEEESTYLEPDMKVMRDGVEVKLKNPSTDGLVDFLKVTRDLSKIKKGAEGSEFMQALTDEGLVSLANLINLTLEKTFPEEWKTDEEGIKQWGMENNMLLINKVLEMCSPAMTHEDKKKARIKARVNVRHKEPTSE